MWSKAKHCGYGAKHGVCVMCMYSNVSCLAGRHAQLIFILEHLYTFLPSLVYAEQSEWEKEKEDKARKRDRKNTHTTTNKNICMQECERRTWEECVCMFVAYRARCSMPLPAHFIAIEQQIVQYIWSHRASKTVFYFWRYLIKESLLLLVCLDFFCMSFWQTNSFFYHWSGRV